MFWNHQKSSLRCQAVTKYYSFTCQEGRKRCWRISCCLVFFVLWTQTFWKYCDATSTIDAAMILRPGVGVLQSPGVSSVASGPSGQSSCSFLRTCKWGKEENIQGFWFSIWTGKGENRSTGLWGFDGRFTTSHAACSMSVWERLFWAGHKSIQH